MIIHAKTKGITFKWQCSLSNPLETRNYGRGHEDEIEAERTLTTKGSK